MDSSGEFPTERNPTDRFENICAVRCRSRQTCLILPLHKTTEVETTTHLAFRVLAPERPRRFPGPGARVGKVGLSAYRGYAS